MSDRHQEAKLAREAEATTVAARCRITGKEARAMLDVRDLLRSGTVPHWGAGLFIAMRKPNGITPMFNMNWSYAAVANDCKTVACIGGHMAILMDKKDVYRYVLNEHSRSLEGLFYPPKVTSWSDITPADAADAIDHFAATGEVSWDLPR